MFKIGILILIIVTIVLVPVISIYGLYLSFVSHPVTGIIVLVVEPAPFVVGVGKFIWHVNIADMISHTLNLR